MQTSSVKSPGKIIIAGEHSVVYGFPAIIVPINIFVHCEISPENRKNTISIIEGSKTTHISIDKFQLDKKDFNYLLTAIINNTFKYFKISKLRAFTVNLQNDIPTGGLGRSTAISSAVSEALCKYLKIKYSKDDIWNIVMDSEQALHDYRPSGGDQTAIVYNKFIYFKKRPEGNLVETIKNPSSELLRKCIIIDSGRPDCNTGEVVAMVKARMEKNPGMINKIFESITIEVDNIRQALLESKLKLFTASISKLNKLLIELGIVSPETQKLLKDIYNLGGIAKISGAGTIGKGGSGAIFCFSENKDPLIKYLNEKKINYFLPWA